MKTWAKIVLIFIVAVAAVGLFLLCLWNPPGDSAENYLAKVETIDIFENDLEDAVPQTEIYNIVSSHFSSALPEGKTVKKAIVLGYDGCRLDALAGVKENTDGAIASLLGDGAKAYISYCGGVKYPEKNTQDTSTAPGWCSMLTGQWADVHGITGNGIIKSTDCLTLLTTLVEEKTINKSAFYVSWKGHFVNDNSTYIAEKSYTEEKNLDVTFECADNDAGTKETVLADVEKADCSDFIFTIFEFCDHSGHQTGFYTEKATYKNAFCEADDTAMEVINKIKARETYETEDWLFVITADHGGINRSHGGPSIQERDTFIVVNK